MVVVTIGSNRSELIATCAVSHMLAAANPVLSIRSEEQEGDPSMNALWIVVGIGIVGGLAKRIAWHHERRSPSELGFVSHQWLAEHRLSQISDPQR